MCVWAFPIRGNAITSGLKAAQVPPGRRGYQQKQQAQPGLGGFQTRRKLLELQVCCQDRLPGRVSPEHVLGLSSCRSLVGRCVERLSILTINCIRCVLVLNPCLRLQSDSESRGSWGCSKHASTGNVVHLSFLDLNLCVALTEASRKLQKQRCPGLSPGLLWHRRLESIFLITPRMSPISSHVWEPQVSIHMLMFI